jgi:hypothetical protein
MNHPLSVYTVVYLAILFVAVSIWGSNLALVCGDGRILAASFGVFAVKLAIDDYVHFQAASKRLHADLWLSLWMYLLLAMGIGGLGADKGRLAAGALAGVFGVGTAWIVVTGSVRPVSGTAAEGARRRQQWLAVNLICVALLAWATLIGPDVRGQYTSAALPLTLLLCVILFDFACLGTLKRLANLGNTGHTVANDSFDNEAKSTRKTEAELTEVPIEFAKEEHKQRRLEIQAGVTQMENDQRNALILTGAVWSWLATTKIELARLDSVLLLPAFLMGFFWWRFERLHRGTMVNAEYLRTLEGRVKLDTLGWETWLEVKRREDGTAASLLLPTRVYWALLILVNGVLAWLSGALGRSCGCMTLV